MTFTFTGVDYDGNRVTLETINLPSEEHAEDMLDNMKADMRGMYHSIHMFEDEPEEQYIDSPPIDELGPGAY